MKINQSLLLLPILLLIIGCSGTKLINKGTVSPEQFHSKTSFTTVKTVIIIPVELNGIKKNFVFDTGAEYNITQRDSIFGRTFTISGASKRKNKFGSEVIKSLKIESVIFENTFSLNENMVGLKEQIPNFGGLIGQPIISKANWLIDYPNKKIEIANKELSDNSFQTIQTKRKNGTPYTFISINGQEYEVIIDLGSSSKMNVPKDSKLGKELLKTLKFHNNKRERYTVGGLQTITEKVGVIPLVTIGSMEFKDVEMNINTSSQPRIGVSFFENCLIYIDNTNGVYRIKPMN